MEGSASGRRPNNPPDIVELLLGRKLSAEEIDGANYNFSVQSIAKVIEKLRGTSYNVTEAEVSGQKIAVIFGTDGICLILREEIDDQ